MGAKTKSVPEKYVAVEVEKHWPQILAILIGAISGFTEGLNFAWTSPFIVQITEDKVNYDISEEQASYFQTMLLIGALIGCPIFSILSDKIGRKKTFLFLPALHIICWLLAAFATDIYLFSASRLCAGLSSACFYAVFPIYIGEITNPIVRGSWGNALACSMYVGEFFINVIGSYCDVKMTSFICLPLPILFAILFSFMPESPYYCIKNGEDETAKKALKFLTRKENINDDFIKLKKDVDRQMSESATWCDLLKIKSNRRALLAGIFLRVSQQTSGLIVFFTYTQTIFQRSGQKLSHEVSSQIFMGTNVVFNLISLFFIVHRFGRKTLYIASLCSCALFLYILGTYFYIGSNYSIDLSSINWLPITGMLAWMVSASFGVSVMPTLMMSELFSVSIKSKAILVTLVFMSTGGMLTSNSFYYIIEYLGFCTVFYIYAICSTIAAVLSFYIVPETRGRTLEEIQQILKKKNMKE